MSDPRPANADAKATAWKELVEQFEFTDDERADVAQRAAKLRLLAAGEPAAGYTVAVYFPPEAPREAINAFIDRVVSDAHAVERDGWDASCVGLAGDPLGVDSDV